MQSTASTTFAQDDPTAQFNGHKIITPHLQRKLLCFDTD
jgi:hypothetical protein